jgi:hypothetical protein
MTHFDQDLSLAEIVSPVQPYAARKRYTCPGCGGAIPPGLFHLVVVPESDPEQRRHWHRGCWYQDQRGRQTAIRRR